VSPRPNIWFCGDPHGEIDHVVRAIERYGAPDAVILLGDLEPTAPLHEWLVPVAEKTVVRYIHGNHDTDHADTWAHIVGSPAWAWNLDGRVETVAGVRIAGLGGIFRERVWYPPSEPAWYSYAQWEASLAPAWMPERDAQARAPLFGSQRRTNSSTIFPATVDTLAALEADVLVTHEAPSGHRHGFPVIDDLAAALGVQRLMHGHHHERVRYPSTARWEAFGVGLREVVGIDGEVIHAQLE
jgi:predicted phosphodiesterase